MNFKESRMLKRMPKILTVAMEAALILTGIETMGTIIQNKVIIILLSTISRDNYLRRLYLSHSSKCRTLNL